MTAKLLPVECPFCGNRFGPEEAENACGACGGCFGARFEAFRGACALVCPRCGYATFAPGGGGRQTDAKKTQTDAEKAPPDAERGQSNAGGRQTDAKKTQTDAEKAPPDAEREQSNAGGRQTDAEKTQNDARKAPLDTGGRQTDVRLTQCPLQQRVRVFALDADEHSLRKLLTLGILPGTQLELERRRPCFLLKVGRAHLALDEKLAACVRVVPCMLPPNALQKA